MSTALAAAPELLALVDPAHAHLLALPGVTPCTACGHPCTRRNKDFRALGVRQRNGQGRCSACYQAKRPPVVEAPRLRPGPPRKPRRDVVHEQPGRRTGINGPTPGALDQLADAACKGADLSEFFGAVDGLPVDPPAEAVAAARTYCGRCPALIACDEFARAHREVGLWAGRWRTAAARPREIRTKTLPGGTA